MKKILLCSFLFILAFLAGFNLRHEQKTNNQFRVIEDEGITDHQPESFKEFILNHNTPVLLENLYRNLDEDSIRILKSALQNILHIPDTKYIKYYLMDTNSYISDFANEQELKTFETVGSKCALVNEKYKFPKNAIIVFPVLMRTGLYFSNDKMKNYVKGKIAIAGGAHHGDSVLGMLENSPSIVYAFDLLDENIDIMKEVLNLNNIPEDKYEIFRVAITGGKNMKKEYKISASNVMGGICEGEDEIKDITVPATDIDTFLKDKKGQLGYIQSDLQGTMCDAILGMEKTIKKDRPILCLDISNSPEEFFYAKPLLEKIVKDLNYKITIINDMSKFAGILGLSIFAYPAELDD